jgi:hypothetical protein
MYDRFEIFAPKPRKTISYYAIDADGVTVAKAATLHSAQRTILDLKKSGIKAELRHVHLDEADLQVEDAAKVARRWQEMLYKPVAARTIRRRK